MIPKDGRSTVDFIGRNKVSKQPMAASGGQLVLVFWPGLLDTWFGGPVTTRPTMTPWLYPNQPRFSDADIHQKNPPATAQQRILTYLSPVQF